MIFLWVYNHLFQSTLPRRERPVYHSVEGSFSLFQSTLPRRERPSCSSSRSLTIRHFNPRSREGSDLISFAQSDAVTPISIHAPAKGATVRLQAFFGFFCHFNPRSREGSDCIITAIQTSTINFNPRSREGSDKEQSYFASKVEDFNPRSREGSDDTPAISRNQKIISIHAPAKGATIKNHIFLFKY